MTPRITKNESTNSPDKFELFCKCIFKRYCLELAASHSLAKPNFYANNGVGGDGGLEAYCEFPDGEAIGLQAKYFDDRFGEVQVQQIKKSVDMALSRYPKLARYIIALPKDLTNFGNGGAKKPRKSGRDRFEELRDSYKKKAPNCAIELWDETSIFELLSRKEYSGLRDFWLSKQLVNKEALEHSLERQIHVETHNKYQPDLAVAGTIREYLDDLLCKNAFYSRVGDQLDSLCHCLLNSWEDLNDAYLGVELSGKPNQYTRKGVPTICENVTEIVELANSLLDATKKLKDDTSAVYECVLKLIDLLNDFVTAIEKKENELRSVQRALNALDDLDFSDVLCTIKQHLDLESVYLFQAKAGYGKTFAALHFMDEERRAVPQSIYVPASYFAGDTSFTKAICKSLDAPELTDEESLFKTLECYLEWTSVNFPDKASPYFAIFVDGLDEIGDEDFWRKKFDEAEFLANSYPFLRFIFLSRNPFGFKENPTRRLISLGHLSDVPMEILIERYFAYYGIDHSLVKEAQLVLLNTPFVLNVFCRCHQRNWGLEDERSSENIVTLIKERIRFIDHETEKRTKRKDLFFVLIGFLIENGKERVTENEIIDALEKIHSYKNEEIIWALNVSIEEGLLYKTKIDKDCFGRDVFAYGFTYQSYIDYLIADKLFTEGSVPSYQYKEKSQLLNFYYIKQAEAGDEFSLTSLKASLAVDDYLSVLRFIALNGIVKDKLKQAIQTEIIDIVKRDRTAFWQTFNNLIVPCARLGVSTFGADMLDKILFPFETPIQRDCLWAYPYPLPKSYFYNTPLVFVSYELFEGDALFNDANWDGLPSLYAWFLCSLDNRAYYKARNRLAVWGIDNPASFLRLFIHYKNGNDPQMIRALCAIAMNVCNSPKTDKEISNGLIDEYASIELEYPDLCVRYYFHEMVVTKSHGSFASFNRKYDVLMPSLDAKGASQDGYKGFISYDLDRYVLTDPLRYMLSSYTPLLDGSLSGPTVDEWRRNHISLHEKCENSLTSFFNEKSVDDLVNKLGKPFGLNTLLEVSLGLLDSYFKQFGWDLSCTSKTMAEGEKAVRPCASTHGLRSRVMTIAEKYTWIVRDILSAYYLDQICELKGEDITAISGFDYSLFEEFDNPYQDYLFASCGGDDISSKHVSIGLDYSKEENYIGNKMAKKFTPNIKRRTRDFFAYFRKLGLVPLFGQYKQDKLLHQHLIEFSFLMISTDASMDFLNYVRANLSNKDFVEYCKNEWWDYTAWKNAHPLDMLWSSGKPTAYEGGRCFSAIGSEKIVGPVFFTGTHSYYLFQESSKRPEAEINFIQPSKKLTELLGVNTWDGKDYLNGSEAKIICLQDESSSICCLKKDDFLGLSKKYRFFWSFASVDNADYKMRNCKDYDDSHYRIILQWLCHQSDSEIETIPLSTFFD